MKSQKLFSLDQDIIERLQEEKNASKIVNDILIDYYSTGKYKQKEEIQAKITKYTKIIDDAVDKKRTLEDKYDQIERKEKETAQKFKNTPKEVLDDFKFWPNMSEEVFLTRFKEYHKKHPNFTKEIALKAYREYFKK